MQKKKQRKQRQATLKLVSSCWQGCCCWIQTPLELLLHSLKGYWSSSQLISETPLWWPWLCSPRVSRVPIECKWQLFRFISTDYTEVLGSLKVKLLGALKNRNLHCLCSVWSSAEAQGMTASSSIGPCSIKEMEILLEIYILQLSLLKLVMSMHCSWHSEDIFSILVSASRGQENHTAQFQEGSLHSRLYMG